MRVSLIPLKKMDEGALRDKAVDLAHQIADSPDTVGRVWTFSSQLLPLLTAMEANDSFDGLSEAVTLNRKIVVEARNDCRGLAVVLNCVLAELALRQARQLVKGGA